MLHKDTGIDLKPRKYLLKSYPKCFVGSEMVDWLMVHANIPQRKEAFQLGLDLQGLGLFVHVIEPEKPFLDGFFFYRFTFQVSGEE